jgi:hypothetical protein
MVTKRNCIGGKLQSATNAGQLHSHRDNGPRLGVRVGDGAGGVFGPGGVGGVSAVVSVVNACVWEFGSVMVRAICSARVGSVGVSAVASLVNACVWEFGSLGEAMTVLPVIGPSDSGQATHGLELCARG